MKQIKKAIAVVLTIALVIGIFSASTPEIAEDTLRFAAGAEEKLETLALEFSEKTGIDLGVESDGAADAENADTSVQTEAAAVVYEDVSKRDRYTKTFKMSDGTMQAAQYDVPVHFEDEGQWTDYDNTLTETESTDTDDKGKKEYKNQKSDFSVRLSKKSNGSKLAKVTFDGYKVSWNFQDIRKRTGKIAETEESEDATVLTKITSQVVYEGVFKNVNLQYIVTPDSLKENIILEKQSAHREFVLDYKAPSLTPVSVDGKTVALENAAGERVFYITAPYMEDALGAVCDNVTLTLSDVSNGKFSLTVGLDGAWLDSDEREYPVTVDPAMVTGQSWDNPTTCTNSFVASGSQWANHSFGQGGSHYEGSNYVGYEHTSGRGINRTYFKMNTLPTLGTADTIVDARIHMACVESNPVVVNVHKVIGSWDLATLTWNNQPEADHYFKYDYKQFVLNTSARWVEWEITELVRQWYSGETPNNGIMFKAENEENLPTNCYTRARFRGQGYPDAIGVRPIIAISYRNTSGYEDYYSYTNMSAGDGGVAGVNNFNGNFVFSQSITEDCGGNLMPVNVSLTYNANKGGTSYTYMGQGVQTNYHIFIGKNPYTDAEHFSDNYKYYLNDSDGTEHYFYFENANDTTAKDEDGLGYTVTVNSSVSETDMVNTRYTVTDKQNNKMYFNGYGQVTRIENNIGQYQTVNYDYATYAPRIRNIIDGAGRAYTFNYSDSATQVPSSLTDPTGRVTTFIYGHNVFLGLVNPMGKTMSVAINDYGKWGQISYDGFDFYVNYDWTSQHRASAIGRFSGGTCLEYYEFSYKQNATVITDLAQRKYTYQFNDFGQTTGVVSNESSQAQFFTYNPGNNTSANANKLLSSSKVQSSTVNFVNNPAFTRDVSTSYYAYSTAAQGTYTYGNDYGVGHFTNGSLKVSKNAGASGNVFALQDFWLPAGYYTLSAFSTSGGVPITGAGRIAIEVWKDGNVLSHTYADVNASLDWTRSEVSINLPENCLLRILIGMPDYGTGTLWFDDVQLERGVGATSYNLLENSAFENGTAYWNIVAGEYHANTTITGEVAGFSKALYSRTVMPNNATTYVQNNAGQMVYTSGSQGDVFAVGGWANCCSAPLDNGTKDGDPAYLPRFCILVQFFNSAGEQVGYKRQNFNPDYWGWQYNSFEVIAPADYASVNVCYEYNSNVNNFYLTGTYLYKETYGQSYAYDENGNVVSSKDLAETNSTFDYNGSNMLSRLVNPSGSSFEYTYSENNLLTQAVSSDGQIYYFDYDNYGNVNGSTVKDNTGTITRGFWSHADYSADGNFTTAVYDIANNKTQYSYDAKGRLQTVTDPKNQVTSYAYDGNSNLVTGVVQGAMSNTYDYTARDELGSVTNASGTDYVFNYDAQGRMFDVDIGADLNTTTHLVYTGYDNLSRPVYTQYGNGARVYTTYDNLDRVTQVVYNNNEQQKAVQYFYKTNGDLSMVIDGLAGTKTKYTYDLSGRMVYYAVYDTTDFNTTGSCIEALYLHYADQTNYVDYVSRWNKNSGGQNITYRYGNAANGESPDRIYGVSYEGVEKQSYTYDKLSRLTQKTVTVDNGSQLNSTYQYYDWGGDCTTTLVTGYTNVLGYYSYNYDANGNIIGEWFVANDGQTRATDYTYDQNGQLTQTQVVYNGGTDSRLYVYEYSNGNITSNTMYYPGGYNQTNLTYDNTANWKDQATVINGENITYDTVGNPLVYRGATLTWENGRQLKSYTEDEQTLTFEYDSEGKRTKKTLPNGVYYEYIYSDGILTSVKSSDFGVNFTYITDESGNYIGFKNYNTMYYFVRNLQNDVVAITDSNGNVIVRYEYDPWGVPTIIADGENYSIGYANMIRYRGYFYDVETGLYYLQSRYYDPSTGRFINSDTTDILSVGSTIYDKNLYSYCDNNPITRVDVSGYIWETVFDVASLCVSIVDVFNNPKDVWAWVGLVADVVDLVPFLTGVGETTKVLTAANRASNYADAVDDVRDVAKGTKNTVEVVTKSKPRTMPELIKDITNSPERWKLIDTKIEPTTGKHYKGGQSIEKTYYCEETGEYIYEHILKNRSGREIDKHFRSYGK